MNEENCMSSPYLALVGGDGPGLTHVLRIGAVALGIGYEGSLQGLSRGEPHLLRAVAGRGWRLDSGVCHGTARCGPNGPARIPSLRYTSPT